MRMKRYHIAGVYDTETCNIMQPDLTCLAYPVCYILNDIWDCDLRRYEPDNRWEHVRIVRTADETLDWLYAMVERGKREQLIPIICAYNLMFDLQPILYLLAHAFQMKAIAQSSTNAYCIDLLEDGDTVLRFWDTFHLEMNGLGAMGRTCGFLKGTGEWDYSLIRTPETPLTELEIDYATRDVQVIPAYLRYLLEANDWLTPEMLGFKVLTKTSLVRQMAKAEIGSIRYHGSRNSFSLFKLHSMLCMEELPQDYHSYALRKACFRGGFTFTAGHAASRMLRNVHSIDVTSMHHAYINGRRIPRRFRAAPDGAIEYAIKLLCRMDAADVLRRYDYPFPTFFHACVRFRNIRLKTGSPFERWGIALLAQSKFGTVMPIPEDYEANQLNEAAEQWVREAGYHDSAVGATFAYGKLYEAAEALVYVSEVEMWNISRVYEWDSLEVLDGEISVNSALPPDYVTLQSNVLYERKNDAKRIDGSYEEGKGYLKPIPASIPAGIAAALKGGDITNAFFHAWYQTTVKGAFN